MRRLPVKHDALRALPTQPHEPSQPVDSHKNVHLLALHQELLYIKLFNGVNEFF